MKTPQFPSDSAALAHLLGKLTDRKMRPSRTRVAKVLAKHGSCPRRDRMVVAYRWLRRHVGGEWYRGGHHVGRLNYGPAICEDGTGKNKLWLDRCEEAAK